jgi:DNA-directed RNA polymerase specialized sigma24 family protein
VDFEELYRATYPRVLAYARSMASREDADDAVAEAYAIAWRRQRDIPRSAELGWLIGVTRRVLANARAAVGAPARCMRCSTSSLGRPAPIPPIASRTESCAQRCWRSRHSTARPSC